MSSPYQKWERKTITGYKELEYMIDRFMDDEPTITGFDTETTGLHIKKDKPFLIVFGWLVPNKDYGRVFTFHPTQPNMEVFLKLAKKSKMFVAWNTTYDMHMLANIGWEYDGDNLAEGMVFGRLSVEAIPATAGGDSLQLKPIGTKYVHEDAALADKKLSDLKKILKAERVQLLTAALKQFNHPTETVTKPFRLDTGKPTTTAYKGDVEWRTVPKKWNKGLVESFLKDITHDVEDLPEEIQETWSEWLAEYNGNYDPSYDEIYERFPNEMIEYAADDVITMLEFIRKSIKTINEREQWDVIKREMRLIKPLFKMERAGFQLDGPYLKESQKRLKQYIIQQRNEMYKIAGEQINVGQHEAIKKVFADKWGIELEKADKKRMKDIIKNFDGEAKRYAQLIKELRTLEKWYSTYCLRLIEHSEFDGRLYMQINQAGAVSGRVGSDGQQFPKDPIKDEQGNILFFPRKAVKVTPGYDSIFYLDFSQIELRNQANYTLLVSGGDLNLCRAYMPYKCHRKEGNQYKWDTPKNRSEWDKYEWYLDEKPTEKWTPTDVHGETTSKAFPQIEVGTDEFKKWRSKGKIFNFMRNYGGGKGAAMEQLDLAEEHADALVRGYSEAFPHVEVYQKAVIKQHAKQGYVTNMYGRRYYLKDNNRAYKLANYLVQGTCADMMKECIIQCDEYLLDMQAKGYKTRMIMTVHDELQFESVKGEEFIIKELQTIMETHEWHLVPIVCDIEKTKTTWDSKFEEELA